MKVSSPAPTRADHRKFCVVEGWQQISNAKGKKGSHHLAYELNLVDGRILRTRISHPPNKKTYGKQMWSHILRDQLEVSEEEFWLCVQEGQKPSRSAQVERDQGIPLNIVHTLVAKFKIPQADVAKMSREEAIAKANELWSQNPDRS